MRTEKIHINKKGELCISVKIPMESPEWDFYSDEQIGTYPTVAGLVDKKLCDCGFVYVISMAYKGKSDQCTDIFFRPSMNIEDFEALCKTLGLGVFYN